MIEYVLIEYKNCPMQRKREGIILIQLKIAICDDSRDDRELLHGYISGFFDNRGVPFEIDEYSCGEDFLKCESKNYDLVFFDIFMDGINGIETAKKLFKRNERTKIIFCSTSSDFAMESYDVYAFHYMLKPVSEIRLNLALERFLSDYTSIHSIEVSVGKEIKKIYLSNIIWVEASRKKCIIHTKKDNIEVSAKFSELYDELSKHDFVKPIRYAIVSLREISNIRNDITLSNGEVIPISRELRGSIKKTFADFNWKVMLKNAGE